MKWQLSVPNIGPNKAGEGRSCPTAGWEAPHILAGGAPTEGAHVDPSLHQVRGHAH
jgi:hypothetical protein